MPKLVYLNSNLYISQISNNTIPQVSNVTCFKQKWLKPLFILGSLRISYSLVKKIKIPVISGL